LVIGDRPFACAQDKPFDELRVNGPDNPDKESGQVSLLAKSFVVRVYALESNAISRYYSPVSTAEIIKHAANAFLSMKISFINLVSDLCEVADADVKDVARGIGLDSRIGPHFLQAGVGFGPVVSAVDVSLVAIGVLVWLLAMVIRAVRRRR
jgi:UDPglucose 6-dehydrogenase